MTAHDKPAPGSTLRRPDRLYQGYIFDLDGTIYLGSELLPGALRLIQTLRQWGKRVIFLSNNPTRDVEMYVRKLQGMGLEAEPSEIITTVFTTTQWILQNAPGAVVYPIAEEPLIRAFRAAGITISDDPSKIDIVVASYDRELTWKKLQIAFEAIWYHRRAKLITTNPDRFCPFPRGHGEVDAGPVVAALENATGRPLDVNCGKPSPVMLQTIMTALDLPVEECLTTGDRLYTEIKMGIDSGMDTALVFTGETTPAMLEAEPRDRRPTWHLERIDQLLPQRYWEDLGWQG
ncbi:HAD family hydrolase [Alkalispirochaeta sphaeroplastigenens]|uniref:HAD family hydrolase n=1 Tax=Alkalispirochaeta sphaeroplastigenens TaxID=1187066 RepID=A0A2S4JNC5_9SPIO|nr:HAD hydrolase-like protein [Alkalispirochaeta sphaeroplastigenens]POR01002.1 HAD family hydrolase [Alkalispirochaeta sphaeroplastigenens]